MAGDRRDPAFHRGNRRADHDPLQPPGTGGPLISPTPFPSLVLASASSARALILERAGLAFTRDPAAPDDVDEAAIKAEHRHDGSAAQEAALALARAKALAVAPRHPGAWVIGADQLLVCGERWFDKPADWAEARSHLQALRGRTHELISAVCVARGGDVPWRHVAVTRLTMIPFSDAFLESYLEGSGPDVLESVGAYRLEGRGAQLFSEIDGDYFTILGLPLLPLLAFLRAAGAIET